MSKIPKVQSILEESIKHIDLSIIAYVSNVLQQAVDDGNIFSENDIYNTLYEQLTAYGICTTEQECYEICSKIFAAMVKKKIVKDPQALKKEIISKLSKDMMVMAQFSQDLQWYHARVDNITDTEVFVTYTDYGNSEWIDPLSINIIDTASQSVQSAQQQQQKKDNKNNNKKKDDKSKENKETGTAKGDSGDSNSNDNDDENDDEEKEEKRAQNVAHSVGGASKGIKLGDATRMDNDVSAKINSLMYKTSRCLTDTTRSDKKISETGLTSRQKKKKKEEMKEKEKVLRFDPKRYMKSMRQKARPEWFDVKLRSCNDGNVLIRNYTMSTLDEKYQLLDNCDIQLNKGVRYGLVGLNGCGKTTLLRRMSRYDIAGFPKHLRILHVEQEVLGDDTTVLDYVISCDVVRKELVDREQRLLNEQNPKKDENADGNDDNNNDENSEAAKKAKSSRDDKIASKLADLYQLMNDLGCMNAEPRAKVELRYAGDIIVIDFFWFCARIMKFVCTV